MPEWKPDLCIYHGDCDDGFGAAWAIWSRWPDCEFVPGHYGKPLPLAETEGKNVLFVDFSAKRPVLEEMATIARSIVVLDHHKTAEEELAPWAGPMTDLATVEMWAAKACTGAAAPIIAVFDAEHSGATMAWRFAHAADRMPQLLAHIEDRDLWRFALEGTREISAALRLYHRDFKVWDRLIYRADGLTLLFREGEMVLRAHQANIEKFIREARTMRIGGHAVPTVNVPYHYASDVAHELLAANPGAPFAACWFVRGDGKAQFSLRSEDNREDVSEIAKAHGGGGHRNAAGFEIDLMAVR